MKILISGLLMVAVGFYLGLPGDWAAGWFDEVILVLKGLLPLGLVGIGGLAILLGVADIRDRIESNKQEKAE